jgi:hypothetical protein
MIKLSDLSQEDKDKLVLMVLKHLVITTKKYFTKDSVLNTELVLGLITLTIERLSKHPNLTSETYEQQLQD